VLAVLESVFGAKKRFFTHGGASVQGGLEELQKKNQEKRSVRIDAVFWRVRWVVHAVIKEGNGVGS